MPKIADIARQRRLIALEALRKRENNWFTYVPTERPTLLI